MDEVTGYLAHHGLHGLLKLADKPDLETYARDAARGHKSIDHHIEALFGKNKVTTSDKTNSKKAIKDWMEKGGITNDLQQEIYNQQSPMQDDGKEGVFQDTPLETQVSEQNVPLQAAKGRMSQYLNTLRPSVQAPKLAFDEHFQDPAKERSYDKAVGMAADPLSILRHVKDGTIEPENVKHVMSLYPELHEEMQKRLTQRITEAQLKKEKPSFKVRQGLSLYMGTPLSGEFSPQNIQAAQAVFQTQSQQQGEPLPPTKSKKSTSTLSKSDQAYLTGNQSLTKRSQKQG